ncbi:acetylornithine deacetylase [Pseudooceanicola sp. HF7]|uniref:acetylornithine deacetylase n=1 Tax=Pseudooceanicola sp. HF7 TaxID=2721560 RepID=UPI001431E9E7|nr:acetylornithine deacetylase [Pseudooceanicola sp. HF7]NIZ10021.1 acetylornithine deacetylase [Pseudooceanicola sp. HF7]
MTSTLEILDRLIGFDTTAGRSNLALIDWVTDFLTRRGARLTRIPAPEGKRAGLFASIGPEGPGVLLSAHVDTVPVTGQTWTRPAFALTREAGRLYGRGTTDMKGFLAAMLRAADLASAMTLRTPLTLSISYDEEIGCLGIAHMIDHLKPAIGLPRAAIVGEPTSMQVALGHKGKAAYRVTCRGRAGHSALAPQFINALDMAADLVTGLRGLQQDYRANGARDAAYAVPHTTFHVGRMQGGQALNIVPDLATLDFEYRHLAADAPDRIEARIDTLLAQVQAQYSEGEAGLVQRERLSAYPGLDVEPDGTLARWACDLAGTGTTKVAFGTEAGFFAGLGIPTVVCGPGDMAGQGHQPDEYLEESALAACDAMLARLLSDLRG